MVHECLKHRWRIALAEEHHHQFVKPIRSSESNLPLIGLLNPNIVISSPDIEFHEVVRVFKGIDKVEDTREGINILDGMRVDIMVVLTGMECSILLWDKKGGHLRGLQWEELTLFEVFINEHFQGLHFLGVERIVLHLMWNKKVIELDGMIKGLVGRKGNFGLLEHICEI